jgi:prevent-host-death family protein
MTSMTQTPHVTKIQADGADSSWTVASAKAHFSELLERARERGPQTITRHGRPTAVLVAAEEWARKTRRAGSLVDFFEASPLRGAEDLIVERSRELPAEPLV